MASNDRGNPSNVKIFLYPSFCPSSLYFLSTCNLICNLSCSQGEEISHNISAGIIQTNQSLALQRLTKTSSGQYTCAASNKHGSSGSNAVQLSVKCVAVILASLSRLRKLRRYLKLNIRLGIAEQV
ncbi:hypothetical protein E2C01_080354 [Portunus trituberculatus]|uniref:Ig-like domain-containing protein n=1 Tax=Portunus trituberculatus TaxID=210409 RepID=A0A5B7IT89_PORTR|nr:hypothetical protein [Portunus trituberculatus]